jgi:hypothetical protein
MEVRDSLVILFLDLSRSLLRSIKIFILLLLYALNTHDTHEIVSRVTELRTFEFYACKVIYCKSGFIKIDDSTLSQQHESIEVLEDIRVWLMDGTDDSSATLG